MKRSWISIMFIFLLGFYPLGLLAQYPADIDVAEPNVAQPNEGMMNTAPAIPAQPNIAQPNEGMMNPAPVVPAWINRSQPNVAKPNEDLPGY